MTESKKTSNSRYIRAVLIFEAACIIALILYSYSFWSLVCPEGYESCFANKSFSGPTNFLILSSVRPFTFAPHVYLTYVASRTFNSPLLALALILCGSLLSTTFVYIAGRLLSKRWGIQWLRSNLPETLRLFQYHDFKIILFLRIIGIIPFDLATLFFGICYFSLRRTLLYTLLGILPESIFIIFMSSMKINFLGSTLSALSLFTVLCAVPLFFYEYIIRKRGTSLLVSLKSVYQEIVSEIEVNNAITKRHTFHSHKAPVLLLYGFFSSRRTLSVIEKNLVEQGFDVLSFNLGGLFNTFFTRSVTETAAFLDYKLKRHREKHGWQKIQIVAHSKGGLVAAHWLLNGGGAIYCNKLITLSTPFSGSYHTYLAIPTPLGLFWKDVWQMRPGSSFLRNLQNAEKPSSPLKIVCFYSDEDKISRGERATFQPFWPVSDLMTIETVEFKGLAHFDFLFKKSVVQKIVQYLDKDEDVIKEVVGKQNEPDKVLKKAT